MNEFSRHRAEMINNKIFYYREANYYLKNDIEK